MAEDRLRTGWVDIASFLGMNERTIQRRRTQLIDCGVVFYKYSNTSGAAYNACAFESKLKEWCALKSKKGEKI